MVHYLHPPQLVSKLVYVNHYYTCGCEVRRIAKDAAEPDQLEDIFKYASGRHVMTHV